MAFTATQLDEIAAWCEHSPDLAVERTEAQRRFFGNDDERPTHYWPGAGDPPSRQRRFLGWFALDFVMSDGRQPAQLAATTLYRGADLIDSLDSVRRTHFVLAIVRSTDGRRSTFLELEDDHMEVLNPAWARLLTRGSAVAAHLVPVRNRYWLAGPGWLEWPLAMGPNMRRELKKFQFDAIQLERLMQGRISAADAQSLAEQPQDATLAAAVARMTAAITDLGRPDLVLSVEEWRALVLRHMADSDPNSYFTAVLARFGPAHDMQDLNTWLGLANNIWNATPQPDRGGRTALELSSAWRSQTS